MKRKLLAVVLASTFVLGSASPALAKHTKKKGSCKLSIICKNKLNIEL